LIQDVEIFIGIAHIAGIFVGFGALISLTRKNEIDVSQLGRIRSIVTSGLMVIVAALIPIGFNRFGLTGHNLWFFCSLIYFCLNSAVGILSLRNPENRKVAITQMRSKPVTTVIFLLLLEIPLQVPLILVLIGLYPDLEPALYTAALFFNLFEAAVVLAQLVYLQSEGSSGERSSTRPLHI
jgi:archaellum biogenesis protein FlaJ (TadC family)